MTSAAAGRLNKAIAMICEAILFLTFTVIFSILCTDVALRYFTGSSLRWASEIPEQLFPWLVMSGVVLAAQHGAHIATVFLADALHGRSRQLLATAGHIAIVVAYSVLCVITARAIPIVADERSPILQIPGSVTYWCLLLGFALIALVHLAEIFNWITVKPEGPEAGAYQ
ncbi:MAG: TRAP transporter small permease [Burkholderiales bacterium]